MRLRVGVFWCIPQTWELSIILWLNVSGVKPFKINLGKNKKGFFARKLCEDLEEKNKTFLQSF